MRLLLDTHVLLWALVEPEHLAAEVRVKIADPANDTLFSAASIWEIAIKARLGRVDFAVPPERLVEAARASGFSELPVTAAAAARVAHLPQYRPDPFDHLLIAQALAGSGSPRRPSR